MISFEDYLQEKQNKLKEQIEEQLNELRTECNGELKKFYATFGSDEAYPFGCHDFVEIEAYSEVQAHNLFRIFYPNREGSLCTNCAFIYNEKEWNDRVKRHYGDNPPVVFLSVECGIKDSKDDVSLVQDNNEIEL